MNWSNLGNRKISLWKKSGLVVFILFLLISLVLTGCGKGNQGQEQASNAVDNTSSGPQKGGVVTIPIAADPTFNSFYPSVFFESIVVNRVLFDGLTKPGKDLSPAPDLATSWEPSEDGMAWTFELRNDVKWHDGQPFTAEDVAYTFNEIVLKPELGANSSSYFKAVDRVEVIDTDTVVFHLKRPFAALPSYLAYNAGILPKHIFEGKDPWDLTSFNKEKPIGTGPFKLDKYVSGQSVELVPNPDYFGGEPYLDRLVYKVVADPNAQIAQALSNELSIFILDNLAAIDRIKSANNLVIAPQNMTQFYWLCLNQENPLFTDVKVRQAMLHAIDRQTIINTVDMGYATIANSPIAPALQADYDPNAVKNYDYNPEKAKELLAEAGWTDTDGDGILDKDGKPFKFDFDFGKKGNLEAVCQMVQQYLKDIGMDVKLNAMEWNAMIQKDIIQRDYDATLNWWLYPNDPDVQPFFHSANAGTGNNIPGYKDEQLDKLLEDGQAATDIDQRKQVYSELQKYTSEVLPYVFLWYPQEIQVRNKNLQGVPDIDLRNSLHYINEWWIQK
jgi:peptide/nickel transport system substrate-binding protein